jgi:hypothetical protein
LSFFSARSIIAARFALPSVNVIANEVAGWFLAAFGIKKGSERERKKQQRKVKKAPFGSPC